MFCSRDSAVAAVAKTFGCIAEQMHYRGRTETLREFRYGGWTETLDEFRYGCVTYFSVAEVAKTFGCIAEQMHYRGQTETLREFRYRNRCQPCIEAHGAFLMGRGE